MYTLKNGNPQKFTTGISDHFIYIYTYFYISFVFDFHRTVLDPYGMMAMLGFLVFLFYLIYNYLNATGSSSGRMTHFETTAELNLLADFWHKMETMPFADL